MTEHEESSKLKRDMQNSPRYVEDGNSGQTSIRDGQKRPAIESVEELSQSRSEARYRTLFESIDEGFCILEKIDVDSGELPDFRYIEVNPAFATQVGVGVIVGKTVRQVFPNEPENWYAHYDHILATGEPKRYERENVTQGRIFEIFAGRVEDGTQRRIAVIFKDVTARKQAEAALRESESRLAQEVTALERLHRMIGRMVTASDMQDALDEILSTSIEILKADFGNIQLLNHEDQTLSIVAQRGFPDSFLDTFRVVNTHTKSSCGRSLRYGRRVLIHDVELDEAYEPYRTAAANAGYRSVQSTPLISHRGAVLGILSTHYREPHTLSPREERLLDLLANQAANLLDHLQVEEELEKRVQERTIQVRQLASELVMAEQSVRQQIAQTLHDDLQQVIYAAEMQLNFLSDDVEQNEEFVELGQMIDKALSLSRQLTVELSPPVLAGEGLTEAVTWLARHMEDLYGLQVAVTTSGHPQTATEEQRILLFQIVRELLSNVIKHSGVRAAQVLLQEEANGIKIRVTDQGEGFDVTAVLAEGNGKFGLYTIHERLQLFEGWADIDSQLGAGTRITLFLPHTPYKSKSGMAA